MADTLTHLTARKPAWLKVPAPGGPNYLALKHLMRDLKLHTVCEEAHCPNIGECWEHRAATFMILGDVCTRNCAYCAVAHGTPSALDTDEPARSSCCDGPRRWTPARSRSRGSSAGWGKTGMSCWWRCGTCAHRTWTS